MSEEKQVQQSHQPNLQHGVFPFIRSGLHPCNKCAKRQQCPKFQKGNDCYYLAEFQKGIENAVMDLDFVAEQDRPIAQLLAKEMGILALCEMYFTEEGMVIHDRRSKKLDAQPLVATYNNFMRSAKQTMAALGLGPAARTKIDLEKANVGKKMKEIGQDTSPQGTEFLDD
ncbi:P27 family phage terminase small subunit [Bacillus sp. 3255]|uniref:P27 family phage terminase small subunit n=1 Tax=Bacillus sp. 3255 TaxID=2817904 RepID=UPI0028542458|nr:P27 family phage terminase small subunit [Bacillus sp. 3255]MDR6883033.1 phage terminase small subunit [Bacillus sp. 3255]